MGYQFIDSEGKQIPVGLSMRIGSDPVCDIVIPGPDVSAHHVIIGMYPDGPLIRDEDSVSGTYVNGERLEHVIMLKPGDRVRIGKTEFIIQSDDANPLPQTSDELETKIASPIETKTVSQTPAAAAPEPVKKKRKGDCLRIGLTIVLVFLIACIVLGGGGYLLIRFGVIPMRTIQLITRDANSEVHIYNFTDKTVNVTAKEDVDENTVTIPYIFKTLKPYESIAELKYVGTGQWNMLLLGSEADKDDNGHCRFLPDPAFDYNIVILSDKEFIDDVNYLRSMDKLPAKGSDLIMSTYEPGESQTIEINAGKYKAVAVPAGAWVEFVKSQETTISQLLTDPESMTQDQIKQVTDLINNLSVNEQKIYERARLINKYQSIE